MIRPLDQLLLERSHPVVGARRWASFTLALALHGGFAAWLLLAPYFARRNRPPIEFVAIKIVPVQALGVREPRPEPPRPEPARPTVNPEPTPRQPAPAAQKPAPREERPAPAPAPREAPAQREGSPFGSATGNATFGAAIAGLDNPDFVYGYYIDQMLAMIGSHWVRPPVGGGVEAIIHFRIASDGQISELEVIRPSGVTSFDLAGLRAVRQAAPMPPLPRSFPHDSLGVNLIVK